jgi:hypothetical protein
LRRLTRRAASGFVVSIAAVAMTGSASASSGLLGTSLPTDVLSVAANCPSYTYSEPFAQFGDTEDYYLVPGGSFETGTTPWTLSGGAQVVQGNESYYVNSPTDSQSLDLPPGSSATTPPVCIGAVNPDLRLFAKNDGAAAAGVEVSINVTDALGVEHTFPVFGADLGQPGAQPAGRPDLCHVHVHASGGRQQLADRRRLRRSDQPGRLIDRLSRLAGSAATARFAADSHFDDLRLAAAAGGR